MCFSSLDDGLERAHCRCRDTINNRVPVTRTKNTLKNGRNTKLLYHHHFGSRLCFHSNSTLLPWQVCHFTEEKDFMEYSVRFLNNPWGSETPQQSSEWREVKSSHTSRTIHFHINCTHTHTLRRGQKCRSVWDECWRMVIIWRHVSTLTLFLSQLLSSSRNQPTIPHSCGRHHPSHTHAHTQDMCVYVQPRARTCTSLHLVLKRKHKNTHTKHSSSSATLHYAQKFVSSLRCTSCLNFSN